MDFFRYKDHDCDPQIAIEHFWGSTRQVKKTNKTYSSTLKIKSRAFLISGFTIIAIFEFPRVNMSICIKMQLDLKWSNKQFTFGNIFLLSFENNRLEIYFFKQSQDFVTSKWVHYVVLLEKVFEVYEHWLDNILADRCVFWFLWRTLARFGAYSIEFWTHECFGLMNENTLTLQQHAWIHGLRRHQMDFICKVEFEYIFEELAKFLIVLNWIIMPFLSEVFSVVVEKLRMLNPAKIWWTSQLQEEGCEKMFGPKITP